MRWFIEGPGAKNDRELYVFDFKTTDLENTLTIQQYNSCVGYPVRGLFLPYFRLDAWKLYMPEPSLSHFICLHLALPSAWFCILPDLFALRIWLAHSDLVCQILLDQILFAMRIPKRSGPWFRSSSAPPPLSVLGRQFCFWDSFGSFLWRVPRVGQTSVLASESNWWQECTGYSPPASKTRCSTWMRYLCGTSTRCHLIMQIYMGTHTCARACRHALGYTGHV